ncbi:hypothetical protein [Roseospira marina]|uniref:hypothetical protein n=1 Tax=Roseospira marina TaxID=140057 RepID=UPI00185D9794|nr:hypothetical protein [Roseospira marina]MBB5087812.1 hypothetical protein [Roseospira marina]
MDDAAQNTAIIDTPRSGPISRKVRLNGRPLLIAQPKFACHDPNPAVSSLESRQVQYLNTLIEF